MFTVILYQPEIPPNTGNIMRLCANSGCALELIKPLGYSLSDKHMKRAGLDYVMQAPLKLYESWEEFLKIQTETVKHSSTLYLCSTKAKRQYSEVCFKPGDRFLFGPETRGLPQSILDDYPDEQKITIPMQPNVRSLNLSNAVAIVVYEAWRQQGFA